MKKNKTYSLLICLLLISLSNISYSQKPTIIWDNGNTVKEKEGDLIAIDTNTYIKISYDIDDPSAFRPLGKKNFTFIKKLDSKFNIIKSVTIPFNGNAYAFDEYFKFNNALYHRSATYDSKTKEINSTARRINLNTLEEESEVIDFGNLGIAKRTGLFGVETAVTKFVESKDRSKLLIFTTSAYDKKKKTVYSIKVYENNMNKAWEKNIELPYEDNIVVFKDCFITNDGKVGILVTQYDNEIKRYDIADDYKKLPTFKTKLFLCSTIESNPKELLIDIQNNFVHTIDATAEDINGNITLFGLSKTIQHGFIDGYFVANIDTKNNTSLPAKIGTVPKDVLQAITTDHGFKDPSTRKLEFRWAHNKNNSTDYVFEYYKDEFLTSAMSSNGATAYTYGDILDISINKNTGNATFIRIPKYQAETGFIEYSGFKSLAMNDKLYFFYNDNKKNLETDLSKAPLNFYAPRKLKVSFNVFKAAKEMKEGTSSMSPTGGDDGVFVMATIDESGTLKREILIDEKQQNITPCVINSIKLNKNKISLYQYYKVIFGSLELN